MLILGGRRQTVREPRLWSRPSVLQCWAVSSPVGRTSVVVASIAVPYMIEAKESNPLSTMASRSPFGSSGGDPHGSALAEVVIVGTFVLPDKIKHVIW